MSIDYEALLRKYMRHIINAEGVDYILTGTYYGEPGDILTRDDLIELERIATEIDKQTTEEWERWKAEHPAPNRP